MNRIILVSFVLSCLACLAAPNSEAAKIKYTSRGTNTDTIIVFLHGAFGDSEMTFKHSDEDLSWPDLLANDYRPMPAGPQLSDYAVARVEFETDLDSSLSIDQISQRLRTELADAGILKYNHIFFIAHSLGGIILKRVIIDLLLTDRELFDRIAGVFLFAVPSQGVPAVRLIRSLSAVFPTLLSSRFLLDLDEIGTNSFLQAIESQWLIMMRSRKNGGPKVFCAFETKAILGITVVPQAYTTSRCDNVPRAENSDHVNIV